MTIKIKKIEPLKTEIIHHGSAVIRRDKNKLSVESDDIKCEFKKDEMYLYRKTKESVMEGVFSLSRQTSMVMDTQYGQTQFEVKTIEYEKSATLVVLKYELYSQSQLVDTFHFQFSLIDREDGAIGYA